MQTPKSLFKPSQLDLKPKQANEKFPSKKHTPKSFIKGSKLNSNPKKTIAQFLN